MEPYHHRVQYYETDKMGITHHSNYIRWMEEARIDFLEQLGYSYGRLEQMGIGSLVLSVECRYRAKTTFPDDVSITVRVEQFSSVRLRVAYEMTTPDGTRVCQARSEHCFVNGEGSVVRLARVCPELAEKLAALAEE